MGGAATITAPAVALPHRVIAEGIVTRPSKMGGREMRFLRAEMGPGQEKPAGILKVTLLKVSRWEREETPIKDTAETLVRLMAVERLALAVNMDIDGISAKVMPGPRKDTIRIDGSDPKH